MAATKRAWKLQEFVAHGSAVNCLALGYKSGRVMVTGGEDKKVNMWAVGKPNCIMSLSGHTSPVECVRFGNAEELVVAGSQSGSLKIWDLEAAKIVRTLTGHKSNIRSLDFHPYGEFVASGSMDTNIKLWDVRRKGCIFTYKGHTDGVNCIRFSPDGRWIASAGEDSSLKMWDLTAGKMIQEFKGHTGPVTGVEFHPNEFLLASGSADRTVKFWDLETFQLVSSTGAESGAIRCIFFHPDGKCLFGGSQDALRVFAWEPGRCLDAFSMGWGKVADISVASSQLIGASFSQTNVSVYIVDLNRAQMSGPGMVSQPVPSEPAKPPMSASGRRTFITERPPTSSTKKASEMKTEPEEEPSASNEPEDDSSNVAQIQNPEDYKEVFQGRTKIERTPPRKLEPFPAPPEDQSKAKPYKQPAREQKVKQEPVKPATIVPADRNKPADLNMAEFLPKRPDSAVSADPRRPPEVPEQSEDEVLSSVHKGHESMCAVLGNRHRNLEIVRALWTSGDIKTSVDSAVGMKDLSVMVDLLNVLILKHSLWTLDLCTVLLPQIHELMASKYESYCHTACNALKIVLRSFSSIIKTNVKAPPSGHGVDISREERYKKCKVCHGHLMAIRGLVEKKQSMAGKLGSTFRELQIMLNGLDD
ncbi:katanin p80 WD40 repeat-containing subunit B1-like isoform X5 [Branchiostoma lanceolatum]|uniref:Katanin p80 WD40 repeat-containing subunit B1 n=1 Tax=Branchiostoma lanceolatum TaxID=7740 RepID=A0A8K0EZU6_BRALA|nr:KATNB1 [Branchiostoma lanceolatum]